MNDNAEDEPVGPSLESDNQEERILARRLRIQRRQEVVKRIELGEDDANKKAIEHVKTHSQQQMEDSYLRLRKLHDDGFEMVTNIRVAGDSREVARRLEEEDVRRQRKEKLEAEAKAGAERFEEITKKWEVALQKEIPQDLHDMLNQQKTACDSMLDEKNKLITEFQSELKSKDDQYVRDLKKQAEDIDLLIERMESQAKELTKSYQEELHEIERAFVRERTEMLEQNAKRWDQMLHDRRQKEIEYMEIREKRVEEFEQQLQYLRVQDAEEYNQVKIKLETDVQILQQQLQQMKATYQLNQEKLEYNFQVLRKRDEENSITKSQQKRKITRLHDVLTNLKRKLEKQEKAYRDDNQSLTADYKHQLDQFQDVQRKAKTFMGADAKKFSEIWEMNEIEAKQLSQQVHEADRVIYEQQLGLTWSPSTDVDFMNNVGPIVSQKDRERSASSKRLAHQVLNTEPQTKSEVETETDTVEYVTQNSKSLATVISQFSPDLVKQILELLCDESGFLIESKLLTLLEPLQSCEQNLMKLDAIFNAMGIESEEDVQTLSRYFVKFQTIEEPAVYDGPDGSESSVMGGDAKSRPPSAVAHPAELTSATASHQHQDHESAAHTDARPESAPDSSRSKLSTGNERETVASDERLQLITANDVLKALRTFVEETHKHKSLQKSQMASNFTIVNVNERDDSEDAAYWRKYKHVLSKETEKVWDALLSSFEKYYDVLTARGKLIEDTDALKQQNGELRLLLHQYVNSKVNQELQIPPTNIFQFNRIM